MKALVCSLVLLTTAAPPPLVAGPRSTSSLRPVYRFSAAGAVSFRCAFDTPRLHRCAARYSERLAPGRHVLRVRAVSPGGRLSRIATVTVLVRTLAPDLTADRAIGVGQGPGVPTVGAGAVWVPNTSDGTLSRIDPASRAVTATITGLPPAPPETGCGLNLACGYLNAAIFSAGDVWVSSDFGGFVARIDSSSNQIADRVPVAPRPGGLAVGGGFIWAFHVLGSAVDRIDPSSGSVREFTVPDAQGAGIAYTRGAVWLLSNDPPTVLRLDPVTLAVTARVPLEPFGVLHPFRKAWSLAADERSLWAANPNYDMVTQIDAATAAVKDHVRLPRDQPFGVALEGRDVWVAARTGVVRIDATAGAVTGQLILPTAGSGYTAVVYGFGAAWVTNYDRGTLVRVRARAGRRGQL